MIERKIVINKSFVGKPNEEDRNMFEEFAARRPIREIAESFQIDTGTLERVIRNCCRFYEQFYKSVGNKNRKRLPSSQHLLIFSDFANGLNVNTISNKWNFSPSQIGLIVRDIARFYLAQYRAVAGYK